MSSLCLATLAFSCFQSQISNLKFSLSWIYPALNPRPIHGRHSIQSPWIIRIIHNAPANRRECIEAPAPVRRWNKDIVEIRVIKNPVSDYIRTPRRGPFQHEKRIRFRNWIRVRHQNRRQIRRNDPIRLPAIRSPGEGWCQQTSHSNQYENEASMSP
jgi:hypothetical protein